MNEHSYDVARLAAFAIELVLSTGATVEQSIAALSHAEKMLREAHADELGQPETAEMNLENSIH